ncbi:MAG: hypothetical protein ABWZ57_03820 [Mesorhizobium sp.]|jgi:hypothetical protein
MTSHMKLGDVLRAARAAASVRLPAAADLYVTLDPWGTICCSASVPTPVSIVADSLDEFLALLTEESTDAPDAG